MRFTRFVWSLAAVLAFTVGCSNGDKPQRTSNSRPSDGSKTAAAPTAPAQQPAPAAAPARPAIPDPLRGKVKETMDAGGYSYVLVSHGTRETWAAAKQFAVSVGDEVELAGLMPMGDFHSPTLNRTFEVIQFVGRARVIGGGGGGGAAPPATDALGMPAGHPAIGEPGASARPVKPAPPNAGEIVAIADGVTVSELFAKKADLNGKPVKFRGRVVKANRGILGKNWLHIQDGTGAAGTNDITVTSVSDYADVGSLVVVEGTLGLNRDFGSGYSYAVIVEEAKVTLESPKP